MNFALAIPFYADRAFSGMLVLLAGMVAYNPGILILLLTKLLSDIHNVVAFFFQQAGGQLVQHIFGEAEIATFSTVPILGPTFSAVQVPSPTFSSLPCDNATYIIASSPSCYQIVGGSALGGAMGTMLTSILLRRFGYWSGWNFLFFNAG